MNKNDESKGDDMFLLVYDQGGPYFPKSIHSTLDSAKKEAMKLRGVLVQNWQASNIEGGRLPHDIWYEVIKEGSPIYIIYKVEMKG